MSAEQSGESQQAVEYEADGWRVEVVEGCFVLHDDALDRVMGTLSRRELESLHAVIVEAIGGPSDG